MELKWLEDFLSVVARGHFAKAAEDRFVTQSALSRRIKSLELWVGAELLDRSQHPISLTKAGQAFKDVASSVVADSYAARAQARRLVRRGDESVTVACLHTLALFFVPKFISGLQHRLRPFEATVIAETRTVEEYFAGVASGESDFFITYTHPSFPFDLDEQVFDKQDISVDHMRLYGRDFNAQRLSGNEDDRIPFLTYASTSFMSRVVEPIMHRSPFRHRLDTVYTSSLAEALCTAANRRMGIAWLPETIARENAAGSKLVELAENLSEPMTITLYRAKQSSSKLVQEIWASLAPQAHANLN